jgi:hypothetical protein
LEIAMTDPIIFAATTPRFSLPLLFAGQAQKETTVNEAMIEADILLHATIEAEINTPPSAPVSGQAWLAGSAPTGAFSGKAAQIAAWTDGGWRFIIPRDGVVVFDRNRSCLRLFCGGWRLVSPPANANGGTVIDVQARNAIATLITQLQQAGIFST